MTSRDHTLAQMRRWAAAVADGVSHADFRARFGFSFDRARIIAAKHGIEVPSARIPGDIRSAKAPQPWVPMNRRDRRNAR